MTTRGIRGATTTPIDTPDAVLAATRELLQEIVDANPTLDPEDISNAFFTVTEDICSVHPALAARQLGWLTVPLLCAQEIPVPNSLPLTIRVLIQWNTTLKQTQINHVYLGEAVALRPDIALSQLKE